MIEINGKQYRNLQEQVQKNMDDIEVLKEHVPYEPVFYNKDQTDAKFVSKDNLTDSSIDDVIVADSEIKSGSVELKAVSSEDEDVNSSISMDSTSAVITVNSGEDYAQVEISDTDINLTGSVKVNGVLLKPETYEYSLTFFTGTAGTGPFQYFNVKFITHDVISTPTTYADVANIIWNYGTSDNDTTKKSMKAYSWDSVYESYTNAVVWADNATPKKVYTALEGFVRIECTAIFSTITLGRRTI